MDLQITKDAGVHVVHVPSELLDRLIIEDWIEALLELVEHPETSHVIISFDATNRFGSQAIGGLLRAARRLRERGKDLKLCGMSRDIRRVFKIMSLDGDVFDIQAGANSQNLG